MVLLVAHHLAADLTLGVGAGVNTLHRRREGSPQMTYARTRRGRIRGTPHRFKMTTSRYSLGTTMVPSAALFMLAMRAFRSSFSKFCRTASSGIGMGGLDFKAVLFWLLVGIPLAWGVWNTVEKALVLFTG